MQFLKNINSNYYASKVGTNESVRNFNAVNSGEQSGYNQQIRIQPSDRIPKPTRVFKGGHNPDNVIKIYHELKDSEGRPI